MRLFKGQIEVRETDIIKVYKYYLEVVDKNGNRTYYENDEYWSKREFDKNGNVTYYENSDKFWKKREFDENDSETYSEDSYGKIIDNRFKEMTVAEIEKELGYKNKIKGE